MNKRIIFVLAALSLGTIFCITQVNGQATADLNAMVNATLTALAIPEVPTAVSASTLAPTDTQSTVPVSSFPTGKISGMLSYPSEALPPERVVAWSVSDNSYFSFDTGAGQAEYHMELPTGTYHVIAYAIDGDGNLSGPAGGYTRMVPCGLTAACTDHTLIEVNVTDGADLMNINPADWYADAEAFPPMPK